MSPEVTDLLGNWGPLVTGVAAVVVALYARTMTKTGRTLRRARVRIEDLERYVRRLRRALDDADVDPKLWRYPKALRYLAGEPDPMEEPEDDDAEV